MNTQPLVQLGLSEDQAKIYLTLLSGGLLPARALIIQTGIKRGLTYKVIEQLIEKGLVEKRESPGKIALFFPTHPQKLSELLKAKEQEMKSAEASLGTIVTTLSSAYNLISGKPNVQFFEGAKGMKEILDDSLTSETEIYSYADIEAIQKYIPEVNAEYVKKRDKFNIKKKAIILDTPFARAFLADYYKNVTDIKLIKSKTEPFQTIMQIYDNKISYLTLSDKEMIGVIIEDKYIYKMHKDLFEFSWDSIPATNELPIALIQAPGDNSAPKI